MKQVMGKRARTLLVILLINFSILAVPSIVIYESIEDLIIRELAKNAMNTASTTASLIERELEPYKNLIAVETYAPGTYDEEYYQSMLLLFQKLKKDTGASYIFTEKILDDKIQYILDGEYPASDGFSPIGSEDTLAEIESKAFQEKLILATGMVDDPVWGEFLTGFAPIIDQENGNVVGLVGVDFSLDYVQALIIKIRLVLTLSFCFLVLFATVAMYVIMIQKYKTFERDQLTDLYSKRFFDHQIIRIMDRSRKQNNQFFLAMIDIDDFKKINDNYGHIAGDDILRIIGKLIKRNLRHVDLCFRYGGDELLLILPDADQKTAQHVCERIKSAVGEHAFKIGEAKVHVTMSIGLAHWDGRMGIDELVGFADQEMYNSKREGKNKLSVHVESESK